MGVRVSFSFSLFTRINVHSRCELIINDLGCELIFSHLFSLFSLVPSLQRAASQRAMQRAADAEDKAAAADEARRRVTDELNRVVVTQKEGSSIRLCSFLCGFFLGEGCVVIIAEILVCRFGIWAMFAN